jgi:hypothetical protein
LVGSWIGAYLGHITAAHVDRNRAIEDAAADYIAAVRVLVQALAQEQIFGLKDLQLIQAVQPYLLKLVEAHSKAAVAVGNPNDELQAKIFDLHRRMNTEVMPSPDPFKVYNSKVAQDLANLEDLIRKRRRRSWLRSIWTRT